MTSGLALAYPFCVGRIFHITTAGLLAAIYGLALPLHFALDHQHAHLCLPGQQAHFHAHGPEGDHPSGHCECDVKRDPAGKAEFHDATGYGTPHKHEAHGHAAADQGALRNRVAKAQPLPVALLPVLVEFAHVVPSYHAEAADIAPPDVPPVGIPALRGPPVC